MRGFFKRRAGLSKKCPTCGKPTNQQYRPFCSKFCKDKDLLNWINERYIVSSPHQDENDEEAVEEGNDQKNQRDSS